MFTFNTSNLTLLDRITGGGVQLCGPYKSLRTLSVPQRCARGGAHCGRNVSHGSAPPNESLNQWLVAESRYLLGVT